MANPTALADTIVAIATAVVPAQGSVGIVRLSGAQSLPIAEQIFVPAGQGGWPSHQLRYGWIRDARGQMVDEALAVWMQAPRSYTCEDVVELHCHGGIMAVQATLQLCLAKGARLAEPGEFTLRAFLYGRIDLTQAESIADLVGSYSPQAAQAALAGLQGKVAQPIRQVRQQLLHLLAEIEARIDFEEDLPPLDGQSWIEQIQVQQQQIDHLLLTATRGKLLRTGLKIAIVGRPNVGKSSLLNAWSGEDRAIVTDLPGTTRDVVESQLVVRGIPVHLLDTAGMRASEDVVEKLGVERSHRLAQEADIVVLVVEASAGWLPADQTIYQAVQKRPLIVVINKTDLADARQMLLPSGVQVWVGAVAKTGEGIAELEAAVEHIAYGGSIQGQDAQIAINQRQQAALLRAQSSLQQVQEAVQQALPLDFWSIDLRAAILALGEITGEEVTESVLDRIFRQFCIGK
jgi:tRNA modification GTPase